MALATAGTTLRIPVDVAGGHVFKGQVDSITKERDATGPLATETQVPKRRYTRRLRDGEPIRYDKHS